MTIAQMYVMDGERLVCGKCDAEIRGRSAFFIVDRGVRPCLFPRCKDCVKLYDVQMAIKLLEGVLGQRAAVYQYAELMFKKPIDPRIEL